MHHQRQTLTSFFTFQLRKIIVSTYRWVPSEHISCTITLQLHSLTPRASTLLFFFFLFFFSFLSLSLTFYKKKTVKYCTRRVASFNFSRLFFITTRGNWREVWHEREMIKLMMMMMMVRLFQFKFSLFHFCFTLHSEFYHKRNSIQLFVLFFDMFQLQYVSFLWFDLI